MPKAKVRKFQEQATAKFYTRVKPVLHPVEKWSHCFYCGLPADTMDHVIPISHLAALLDAGFIKYSQIVPACQECNCLAGSNVFEDFFEKRAYVRTRLQKRYKDLLKMPYWFPEQIAEMGPNMAKRLRADMIRQQELFSRLDFDYTLVGTFEPTEPGQVEEQTFDALEWRRIWRPPLSTRSWSGPGNRVYLGWSGRGQPGRSCGFLSYPCGRGGRHG